MSENVDRKIDIWKKKLLDLGKRNRLLNYKFTESNDLSVIKPNLNSLYEQLVIQEKTIDFPHVEMKLQDIEELVEDDAEKQVEEQVEEQEDEQVKVEILGDIVTDKTVKKTQNIAKKLKDKARTAKEEQGINILYASFGFLEWRESENSHTIIKSPLVLVPVDISSSSINDPYTLSLHDDEIVVNPTLSYKLETDFGFIMPSFDSPNDDITEYLSNVSRQVLKYGWKVTETVNISLLSFQRINMYKDLEKRHGIISENPIVKALSGDGNAQNLDSYDFDTSYNHDMKPVMQTFQVVDADSSQQDAIRMSKKGASFILQGPPGTGKSQTITNIIAEALADGKKVLFVSEKMAALEVVYKRLENAKLSDFCLVLHSSKTNKKEFMESLRRVLTLRQITVSDSAIDKLKELEDKRQKLNDYSNELHKTIEPLGQSVYDANSRLAKLDDAPNIEFSFNGFKAEEITREQLRDLRFKIKDFTGARQKLIGDYKKNTWRNSVIENLNHEIRHNLYAQLDAIIEGIGEYLQISKKYTEEIKFNADVCMAEYDDTVDILRFCAGTDGFPDIWLDNANIDLLLEEARECRGDKDRKSELSKIINEFANEGFFDIDGVEKKNFLSQIINEVQSLMICGFSDSKKLLDEIDVLLEQLKRASEVLNEENIISQLLSKKFYVARPKNQTEVIELNQFLEVYNKDMKPNEFWFTSGWGRAAERNECLENLKNLISQIIKNKDEIEEKYDKEILEIDYRGILSRMRTDYTSFVGKLKNGYKHDVNTIRSYCKTPTKKLTYDECLEILEKIKAYYETLQVYEDNKDKFEQWLGGWVSGEKTDIDKIETSISNFDKVKSYYGNIISDEIKLELLSGSNVDKYIEEKNKLSGLIGDKSLHGIFDICTKIDSNTDFDVVSANVDRLISLVESCRNELNNVREYSDGKVSNYECYYNICCLSELQVLQNKEKTKHERYISEFGYLYKGDDTDWDDILTKLDWLSSLFGKTLASHLSEEYMTGMANYPEYAEKSGNLADYMTEFKNKYFSQINDFKSLFTDAEGLKDKNLSGYLNKAKQCKEDFEGLENWLDFKASINACAVTGLEDFIEKVLENDVDAEVYENAFMKRFERLWIDAAVKELPAVASFRGKKHSEVVNEFRELDKEQLDIAKSRIREKLSRNIPNTNTFTSAHDELGILQHELSKQRKIMPVRKMFERIPNLLPKLKPCMMMSPLSVSQFLQSDDYLFDMVIFDEASQVKTENAIGAISRGKQVIIAGDRNQLPPTNFFMTSVSGSDEYDEEEDDGDAYESILEELGAVLPQLTLKWHYRSKNETLIAFSNSKIYHNSLITFPAPFENETDEGVEYIYVKDGVYKRSGKRNNLIEANRVVDVIYEQIKKYPNRSMGVITFSEAQQSCVDAVLWARRKKDNLYEDYFREDKEEPFFIKNLENVQGDERDTIIFSIGYGKANPQEDLKMNFGPLNKEGGERRLNVAITRAKYSIKLVGSILPTDMNITDETPKGVRLLRDYIEYSQQGVKALENSLNYTDNVNTESPFEDSVYDYLVRNGYDVRTQVGCSGYRIDMAVLHPSLHGRFVLGIECDGATYHSSRTARERDRLRQSVLESMGWKIYRIWSTDWVKDPLNEGKHLLQAVDNAIKGYDELDVNNNASIDKHTNGNYEMVVDKQPDEDSKGYGFDVYREKIYPKQMYEVPMPRVANAIEEITRDQAPINIELVCKQVAPLYCNTKVTKKVRDGVSYILNADCFKDKDFVLKEEYLWLKNRQEIIPRVPAEGEKPRPLDKIAPEELAEAMSVIIDKSIGIEKDSLFKVVSKEYGFSRTTENMFIQLEKAFSLLEKSGRVKNIDGKLSLDCQK